MSTILNKFLMPAIKSKGTDAGQTTVLKKLLRVEQLETQLIVDATVHQSVAVSGVWLFSDRSRWHKLTSAVRSSIPGRVELRIDLKAISSAIRELNSENDAPVIANSDDLQGPTGRFTLYLEIEGPNDVIPRASREHIASATTTEAPEKSNIPAPVGEEPQDLVRGMSPLGRFLRTEISALVPVESDDCRLTPYVTQKGNIAIAVNYQVAPFMRVHVDQLTIGPESRLVLQGRIYTRHTSIDNLELELSARSTGHRILASAELEFRAEETALKFGLNRYTFIAQLPLTRFLEHGDAQDDIYDAWLLADVTGSVERHRARVGKNRYLVRRKAKPGTLVGAHRGVSVVPYFTMKAKNVSFQVEHFDRRALSLVDKTIANPIKFRHLARRVHSGRPVWLIGEMPFKAQDTGLSLFKYLIDNHPEIDARYVVDLDSPELTNLVGYERFVVEHRSEEHVLLALAADRIIGSHHPDYIYPTRRREFINVCPGLEIFLQHGVMGMKWMTKTYGKSAPGFTTDLFLTSSEREKAMIVHDFGYSPSEVEVTGLSRFDTLFDDDVPVRQNQVLILPTWRDWLTSTDDFTNTRFFREWQGLLNSSEFHELCRKHDLDVVFGLHPNMRQHIRAFADSPARIFVQGEVNVQTLVKQSAVMITDYSSAGLDFSFLHKPLLYFQFDRSRFFGRSGSHFDLDRELPGPVVSSRNSLIRQLDGVLSTGAASFSTYFERADKLYPFRDQNNRERIVNAISNAKKRSYSAGLAHSEALQAVKNRIRRSKLYFPAMKRFYRVTKKLPMMDDVIVFESGLGRQYADSPRALYEELVRRGDTRTKVWVYNRKLPTSDPYTIVVKRLSPQYFWYLARAKYWVNNQNFPFYITRRKAGVYVQTWHGTPLKKMQHDLEHIEGRDAGYLDRVTQASQQWTHLVSPSPYATDAFSTAFRHHARVLEQGYPRNDSLKKHESDLWATSVRDKLDIPDDKKVLLYAPTFRDDQNIKGNSFSFELPFDLQRFAENFGRDYVLLLRMHVVVRNRLSIPDEISDVVRDVSQHDEINELFAISDALITDYSSVFFDYSILERPIIFYAYDLERYRDDLRGFYLHYGSNLPGPIVTSEQELWDTVEILNTVGPELNARTAAFAAEYAPNDDGLAAARIVDEVF